MDLSNFPTKESAKQMLSMVSPIYDNSYVGKWIFEIIGMYLDPIISLVKGLRNEINPQTATWTLPYWAEEYNVDRDLPEEIQRQEIISKRSIGYPMNPERLRILAERFSGRNCGLEEFPGTGMFRISIEDGDAVIPWDTLIRGLDRNKQAHLSYWFEGNTDETLGLYTSISVMERIVMRPDSEEIPDPEDDTVLADENNVTLQDEEENTFIP